MSESYLVINYVIEVRKTGRDRITRAVHRAATARQLR
jgi:hypothetical protein